MHDCKYIFADGVVADGICDGAKVLSARQHDKIIVEHGKLSAYNELWGEWYPGEVEKIQMYLNIKGNKFLESNDRDQLNFLNLAEKIAKRRKSIHREIRILLFNLYAARLHLHNLLAFYAKLTSVIGPKLEFKESPIYAISTPNPYIYFDSYLSSLKSFSDSCRFLAWKVLERKDSVPRNMNRLLKMGIPKELYNCILPYYEYVVTNFTRYRDTSIHYAPPGAHMSPYLIWSNDVIHAQVWLPINPEARSLKNFRYAQKDAFKYARMMFEQTYNFCDDFFMILNKLHLAKFREKRKLKKRK
ncbi:hypothetical protein ACFL1R_03605 [Candidatus Latescibacterota bacterium]